MKHNLYAIKDELSEQFSQPFAAQNDACALRAFKASAQSTTPNIVNTNPEDKALYRVATYDMHTGECNSSFEKLANAKQYVVIGEALEKSEVMTNEEKED